MNRCLFYYLTILLSVPLLATIAGEDKIVVSEVDESAAAFNDFITPTAEFRARYEMRNDDLLTRAHAETLRGRLGLLINDNNPLSAFIEYEGTLAADRNSYQAASVHGLGLGKSIIADPESHELNQVWLAWDAEAFDTTIKAGRQRINIDNQRFVGAVGWRQNEQTFDAVAIENTSFDDLTFSYHYINRVNRIFGSGPIFNPAHTDFEGNTHLAHFTYVGIPETTVKGYAYFMDLGNAAGDANSNQTLGFSVERKVALSGDLTMPLYGEFAYQEDAFDSPLDYGAVYFHLSAGIDKGGHGVAVGFERLGDDNGAGFRTPLATLHKFNGFNDQFLATPGTGLSDLYIAGYTKLPGGIAFKPSFHWFGPAGGDLNFGQEFDLVLAKKLCENATILAKYSHYFADTFGVDTDDFTIELNFVY